MLCSPWPSRRSARGSSRYLWSVIACGALGLSACSGGASGSTGRWVPQPTFGINAGPAPSLPAPNQSAPPNPSSPGGPSAPGSTPAAVTDPAVVATKLSEPTGLVVLPDGYALVGERVTGRLLRVAPVAGQTPTVIQTLAGLDGTGGGGLSDLALSPTYDEDHLIYAYLTTATDNRVVHFQLGGTPTPVITGIPRGTSNNQGRIAFDATGALLIGTSDAGTPQLAASTTSLAGKILRVSDIGAPMPDNPDPSSPVFATGLHTVDGLCVNPDTGQRVAITAPATVNVITAAADYGWPSPTPRSKAATATVPATATGAGGCALSSGQLAIATSTGQSLLTSAVTGTGQFGTFNPSLQNKYGRLRTVVAAQSSTGAGVLWLTTRNRDGQGAAIADDDRVIRILASSAASSVL